MATPQTDHLFRLIKTLTKAEKRNFRLYVTRNQSQSNEDLKFIQLFDVLDKQKEYQEESILKKAPDLKKEQLSNLKAHLYKQLLSSLRLLHKQNNADIEVREYLDYAKILYNKGLYIQSLRILDKAKGIAQPLHQYFLMLEIVEFEKQIESRHITRSGENRALILADEATLLVQRIQNISFMSNLALRMYGFYLEFGHVRHQEDLTRIDTFFKANQPTFLESEMRFFELVYWYQSLAWYGYIQQDLLKFYRYCYKWVELFEREPSMKCYDTSLYLKGIHNLLISQFVTLNYNGFCKILNSTELYVLKHNDTFDENTRATAFHHLYTAKINKHFMEGTFTEGCKLVPEIETKLVEFSEQLDHHRILVFYYKIASLYFGSGNSDKAIDYLNKVIQFKAGNLRTDIQCFARLLHLIAHFEQKHYSLLEYLIKSVYRFILKNQDLSGIMAEILKFLRQSLYLTPREVRPAFTKLKTELEKLAVHPFEQRSFLYLDILSWLESKIDNKPVQAVIRAKFLQRQAKKMHTSVNL
ncbi:MAG: hypothetical protein RL329_3650 [Bacteroidota bacterium]|jgi:tetratricopeptide (TPR) repeat protein